MQKVIVLLGLALLGMPVASAQQVSCQVPVFKGCPAAKPAFDAYYLCWKTQYKLVSTEPLSNIALNFCCSPAEQQANQASCQAKARYKMAHDLTPLRCAQSMTLYSSALLACPK